MSQSDVCRLCFFTENHRITNIFSDIGNQLKMSEILAEHFKCEVSESDSLPNFVCQMCWNTTEAFHELYQKSKLAQERFLHPVVKIEVDATELYQENSERFSSDEHPIDISGLEGEPITEDHDAFETDLDFEDIDHLNGISDSESLTKSVEKPNEKPDKDSIKRRMTPKKRKKQFDKLFAENKHHFDMTCDECSKVFKSLEEARTHYAKSHNNPHGYIKCCKAKMKYPSTIERHLQRHMNPEKYTCKECGKMYCGLTSFEAHVKAHFEPVEKLLLTCDICKKELTSRTGLQRHLLRHLKGTNKLDDHYEKFMADNFDMSCDQCDSVFDSFRDARSHYRENHDEKKGYIKCCSTKLRELWSVVDHINSHLNPSKFQCDLCCNKMFSSRAKLRQHKARHRRANERPFSCDTCGRNFRDKETILRHLFRAHVDSEPKFECSICQKRFQLEILLKNHDYAVHREKKPIITCEVCGKSFSVKANFDKHVLRHSDKSERLAQRKQCEHCGEWLLTKGGIYYHEQIHSNGIKKCDQCDLVFPHKVALFAHIRKVHRVRAFKCGYCDKSFPVSSLLKKHEESHTRHNTYPCQFCTKVFTLRTSRLTHQKRSHLEKLKQFRDMRKEMQQNGSLLKN